MADFTPEQNAALQELLDDYKAASTEHVPAYKGGGLSRKIAIALIQAGWRRQRVRGQYLLTESESIA